MFSEVTEVYGAVLPLHCNHLVSCRGGGMGGWGGKEAVALFAALALNRLQVISCVFAPAASLTSSQVDGKRETKRTLWVNSDTLCYTLGKKTNGGNKSHKLCDSGCN